MGVQEFQLEYLKLDDLLIDPTYQRDFRPGNAQRLAEKWDWDKFSPLMGNRRNGKVYITDGGHRMGGLRIKGYTGLIPVVTRKGITIKQEAQQFLAQDDRLGISRIEKHRSLLVAEDPVAIGVQHVLDAVGVEITQSTGPNRTQSPVELYRIYKEHGAEALEQTLQIIRKCWGAEHLGMAQIRSIGRIIGNRSPNFNQARLEATLSKLDMQGWLMKATEFEAGKRPNIGDSLWRAITSHYNKPLALAKRI